MSEQTQIPSDFQPNDEKPLFSPIIQPVLTIIRAYTPRSHILCGEALKEMYADFRINVLRPAPWATWHPRLKGGLKGWCIKVQNLEDLEDALRRASIPYVITDHQGQEKKKGPPTAYSFFTKEMWADREALVAALGDDVKNTALVSKYIAKRWNELRGTVTKWHNMAVDARVKANAEKAAQVLS